MREVLTKREALTSALDALGLLLLAAGAAAFAYRWIEWACLAVAGAVVLAGSAAASWQARPPKPGDKR